MAGVRRILFFVLLFYIVCLQQITCHPRGGSHSSRSHSSHSSHSSRPSYSSSYNKHSYPSSSGLSGSSSGSRHSYPSSSGLSGSSSRSGHSYPSSSGLSGSSSRSGHNYPSSSGLSGSSSGSGHNYPSSSGLSGSSSGSRASYPSSSGLSGSSSGSRYPSYPSSSGLSGNSKYTTSRVFYPVFKSHYTSSTPSWNKNYGTYDNSWSNSNNNPSSSFELPAGVNYVNKYLTTTKKPYINYNNWTPKPTPTVVHHHHHHHYDTNHYYGGYHYSPPARVYYSPSYGTTTYQYPVYPGELPTYVYEYRTSGNKLSNLLTGLALYNLGVSHGNTQMHNYYKHYTPESGEKCTFGVKNPQYNKFNFDSYEYEEVRVDCRLISSFLWKEYHEKPKVVTNTTTTITNTTTTVVTSKVPESKQVLHSNGTIVITANNTVALNITTPVNTNMYPNGTLIATSRSLLTGVELKTATNVTANINSTQILSANNTLVNTYNVTAPNLSSVVNNQNISQNQPNVTDSYVNINIASLNVTAPQIVVNSTKAVDSDKTETVKAENLDKLTFKSMSHTILPNGTLAVETETKTVSQTSTVLVTHLSDPKLSGYPMSLDKGIECYVTRTTPTSKMRKVVDCGLLQTYSESSLKKSLANNNSASAMIILIAASFLFVS